MVYVTMSFYDAIISEYGNGNLTFDSAQTLVDIYFENKSTADEEFRKFKLSLEMITFDMEYASSDDVRFIRFMEKQSEKIYELLKESEKFISIKTRMKSIPLDKVKTFGFIGILITAIIGYLLSHSLIITAAIAVIISSVVIIIYNYLSNLTLDIENDNIKQLLKEIKIMKKTLSKFPDRYNGTSSDLNYQKVVKSVEKLNSIIDKRIMEWSLFIFK